MGRKTWEAGLAQGGGGTAAAGVTTYVFSRTLREIRRPGVHLVSSDPGAFVRELKRRPGGEICVMGGGELARTLLAAGVVDAVGANIHPVLLGRGVPLFRDPGRRVTLELAECRTLDGGCVLANYRVRHDASADASVE
jgi:dihydrofolate reductase